MNVHARSRSLTHFFFSSSFSFIFFFFFSCRYGEEEVGAALQNRAQAGFALSAWLCARRYGRQLLRNYGVLAMDLLLTWGAALFVALIHAATLRTNVTDVIDPAGDFYSQSPAFFLLFVLTVGLVPVEILQRTFLD